MILEQKVHYCPIARTMSFVGDKWTLLILRDLILQNKTRFKELKASRERIATNILTNRLKMLLAEGFIEYLNPAGTKKTRQYVVTKKGLQTLPIIIELYLFSVHAIDEALLSKAELIFKEALLLDVGLFKEKKTKEYLRFSQAL
jgi:DNA-binding HxlR family transcriptional regulator